MSRSSSARLGGVAFEDGVLLNCRKAWSLAIRTATGEVAACHGRYPPFTGGAFARSLMRGAVESGAAARLRGTEHEPMDVTPRLARGAVVLLASGLFGVPLIAAYAAQGALGIPIMLADVILRLLALAAVVRIGAGSRVERRYHGAEHQVVARHEQGLPRTLANAARQRRRHLRCGTNVAALALLTATVAITALHALPTVWHLMAQVPLALLAGATGYWAAEKAMRVRVLRPMLWPGMLAQRYTTAAPGADELKVALVALDELTTLVTSGAESQDGRTCEDLRAPPSTRHQRAAATVPL